MGMMCIGTPNLILMPMPRCRLEPKARHREIQIGGMDTMCIMDMECITVRRMEQRIMMMILVMKKAWMKL
jgi:hypothetical protein